MKEVFNASDTDVRLGLNLIELVQAMESIPEVEAYELRPVLSLVVREVEQLRHRIEALERRTWWSMLKHWIVGLWR